MHLYASTLPMEIQHWSAFRTTELFADYSTLENSWLQFRNHFLALQSKKKLRFTAPNFIWADKIELKSWFYFFTNFLFVAPKINRVSRWSFGFFQPRPCVTRSTGWLICKYGNPCLPELDIVLLICLSPDLPTDNQIRYLPVSSDYNCTIILC